MPLAFNWQSAPFGLPALVGYMFPLRYAYTVGLIVILFTAGSGAYVFGRVLRLGIIGSALAGTVFALSGAFIQFLGWPIPSVMSWSGWLFAAAILVIRGHHRVRWICLLAVALAFSIYAGYPESLFLLVLALGLFVIVQLVAQRVEARSWRPVLRSAADLVTGTVAGFALAAPLLLPAVQLIGGSARSTAASRSVLPAQFLTSFLFNGFDSYGKNVPIQLLHGQTFPTDYVGAIALALALLALLARWRKPEVIGLALVLAVMVMLLFVPAAASALQRLPIVGTTELERASMPAGFALAMLSGVGLDVLARSWRSRRVQGFAFLAFGAFALVVIFEWVFGRSGLTTSQAAGRATSFIWPAICVAVGLAVLVSLVLLARDAGLRRKIILGSVAVCTLLAVETGFLVDLGTSLPVLGSTNQFFPTTSAVKNVQRLVGSNSLVGTGVGACSGLLIFPVAPKLGFLGETNIVYGLHSLVVYDPIIPQAYFKAWTAATGASGGLEDEYFFCPAVTTTAEARLFGVHYILEPHGQKGPVGSHFLAYVGNGEDLYSVPGAAAATLTPIRTGGALPPDGAAGSPVAVQYPNPSTWRMALNVKSPSVLRLRLTNVPGWHATVNGRSLALTSFAGLMFQARLPRGHDIVELSYWPTTFTIGLVLFAAASIGLSTAAVVAWSRSRLDRRRRNQVISVGGDEGGPN
jgi:hypothetical protein